MTKLSHYVISRCVWCQFHSNRHKKPKDVQIMQKPSFEPFQAICLDLMEFTFASRITYLLTFLDLFTLHIDGEVLYSKSAEVVASAVLRLLMKYNCSFRSTLIMDNGREFKNEHMATMLKSLGIVQTFTSPFNSRANRIERSHRELRHNLKVLNPNGQTFSHKASLAMSAWNASPQKGLNFKSPTELLYGIPPLNHLGFLKERIEENNDQEVNDKDLSERLDLLRETHRQQCLRNMLKYEQSAVTVSRIKEGDLVIIHDPKLKMSHDIFQIDKGPFLVIKLILRTAKLRHILSNFETMRNTRYLQKLTLTDDDKKKILNQNLKMIEHHTILPLPKTHGTPLKIMESDQENPRRSERIKLQENKQETESKTNLNKGEKEQRESRVKKNVYKDRQLRRSARIKNRK